MSHQSPQLGEILLCGAQSPALVGLRRISSKWKIVKIFYNWCKAFSFNSAIFCSLICECSLFITGITPTKLTRDMSYCQATMLRDWSTVRFLSTRLMMTCSRGLQVMRRALSCTARSTLKMSGDTRRWATLSRKADGQPKTHGVLWTAEGRTFGLKFWRAPNTINGQVYHSLLQYHVLPEIRALNGGNLDKWVILVSYWSVSHNDECWNLKEDICQKH